MNIKVYPLIVALVAMVFGFAACNDDMTYADMVKAQNKAIESFVRNGCHVTAEDGKTVLLHVDPINVIGEDEFERRVQADAEHPELNVVLTDVSKNEYVLFANRGVYLQVVRKGPGKKIADGENCQVICRFHEFNITQDSLQLSNRVPAFEQSPDIMSVSNRSGSFTATFVSGLMSQVYGTAVPSGWLMALPYVNLGRQTDEEGEIAMVRLIVPSSEGQSYASNGVYGCFYEITMQRGR